VTKKLFLLLLLFTRFTQGFSQEETTDTVIYKNLRYDENYSFLRDKTEERKQYPFSYKFIPLNKKETAFLTLGGEARWQFEHWTNPDWSLQELDQDNYLFQRYLFHADFHFNENFRIFGQMKSGLVLGKEAQLRTPDRDRLRLHQLFSEYHFNISEDTKLIIRPGRQEMEYGDARYVTVREGPNVRLSFDALKIMALHKSSQYDLFLSRPVTTDPGFLDSRADSNELFWGMYTVHSAPFFIPGNIDLYYFGLEQLESTFDQGTAYELRHSIGARFHKATSQFYYDLEFQYQFGQFGTGNINAYTFAGEARYKFHHLKYNPELNLRAGIISGNRNPNDPNLQTFNPHYPQGAIFGQLAQIGPTNVIDIHPEILIYLPHNITVDFTVEMFWRHSLNDGVYKVPYNLLVPSGMSQTRYIGEQYTTEVHWQLTAPLSLHLFATYFNTGRYLQESGAGSNIIYVAPRVTYMF